MPLSADPETREPGGHPHDPPSEESDTRLNTPGLQTECRPLCERTDPGDPSGTIRMPATWSTAMQGSGKPGGPDRWGIILAGGDGTRLRSLTRTITGDDRPKQFCPILDL